MTSPVDITGFVDSLTPEQAKTFAKFMLTQRYSNLQLYKLLTNMQCGFNKQNTGRGTHKGRECWK